MRIIIFKNLMILIDISVKKLILFRRLIVKLIVFKKFIIKISFKKIKMLMLREKANQTKAIFRNLKKGSKRPKLLSSTWSKPLCKCCL